MFRRLNKRATLIAGFIAAVLFCVPASIYIKSAEYENSWLLYLGSFLFMVVMWVHIIRLSLKKDNNESTVALAFAAHMTAIAGIIFSCIICFLLLSLLVPGYLTAGNTSKELTDTPVNMIHDKTNGLSFSVFMAATVINFAVGSFTGIVLPFYLKKSRVHDQRKTMPLHNRWIK